MSTYRNEHEFNREWTRWLEAAGALVVPLVGSQMQRPGLPDRYVAHRRFAGFVEGKVRARQLTTAQRIVMKDLVARRVPALELKHLGDGQGAVLKAPDGTVLDEMPWPPGELSSGTVTDQRRGQWFLGVLEEAAGQLWDGSTA